MGFYCHTCSPFSWEIKACSLQFACVGAARSHMEWRVLALETVREMNGRERARGRKRLTDIVMTVC